jgi:hypothetical protein
MACTPSNRLVNTTWEGHNTGTGEEASVAFGENSFQLTVGGKIIQTGSYTISGDAIYINNSSKPSGSLIGDKLILSGLLVYEFIRAK